eukprot:GFYU01002217.1.p1 GENE.GFYU01002217.1~~GFYU01002217.1.p1  ORF type:complete len:630 (-),score=163.91 GFYU01002217.1:241-2130(-)
MTIMNVEEDASHSTLEDLSEDVLVSIFELLPQCDVFTKVAAVSKAMRSAVHGMTSVVVSAKEFGRPWKQAGPKLGEIVEKCHHLTEVRLEECHTGVDDEGLGRIMAKHGDTLIELSLSGPSMYHPVIECKNLSELSITQNNSMLSLTLRTPKLIKLDLSKTCLSDFDLKPMLTGAPNLKSLRLAQCKNIASLPESQPGQYAQLEQLDMSGTKMKSGTLREILQLCPRLKGLCLTNCQLLQKADISLQHLEILNLERSRNIAELKLSCPRLTKLNVEFTAITDADMSYLLEHCRNLRTLNAGYCYELGNSIVVPDGRTLELESMDLHAAYMASGSLNEICSASPKLRALNLRQCSKLGSFSFHRVCPSLRDLSLQSLVIEDTDLSQIVAACPVLDRLYIRNCKSLECGSLVSATLRVLDISLCPVTEDTLAFILANNPALEELTFNNSQHVNNPVIESQSLVSCSLILCGSIVELTVRAPNLEFLDLSNCYSMLYCNVKDCPQLEFVNVTGNPSVLSQRVLEHAPHVKLHDDRKTKLARLPTLKRKAVKSAARRLEEEERKRTLDSVELRELRALAAELEQRLGGEEMSEVQRYGVTQTLKKVNGRIKRELRTLLAELETKASTDEAAAE